MPILVLHNFKEYLAEKPKIQIFQSTLKFECQDGCDICGFFLGKNLTSCNVLHLLIINLFKSLVLDER